MARRLIFICALAVMSFRLASSALAQESAQFDLQCKISYATSRDWIEKYKSDIPVRLSIDLVANKYANKTSQNVAVSAIESADEASLILHSEKTGSPVDPGMKFEKFDRKNRRYMMHEGHIFDRQRSYVWGSGSCELKPFSGIPSSRF